MSQHKQRDVVTEAATFDLEAFWADDDAPQLPAVRDNFVKAAPVRKVGKVQVLPPEPVAVQPASLTQGAVSGSHLDRAKSFNLVALPLAGGVGVGSLIVGLVGFSVPIMSVAALAWLWSGFLLTWLIAWGLHLLFSADGVSLLHTVNQWDYLKREQRERWRYYNRQLDQDGEQ